MNEWLDFFSSLIDSLAWPAFGAIALYVFRAEARELIQNIRRFRAGTVDVEIGKRIDEIKEGADELPVESVPAELDEEKLRTAAELSPRGLLLDTWVVLEDELRKAAGRVEIDVGRRASALPVLRELEQGDYISPEVGAMIGEMRALRNRAAHHRDIEVSADQAFEYAKVGRRTGTALQGLEKARERTLESAEVAKSIRAMYDHALTEQRDALPAIANLATALFEGNADAVEAALSEIESSGGQMAEMAREYRKLPGSHPERT